MCANDNQGQFPASFELAASYFREAFQADPFLRDEAEFIESIQHFEIVYRGSQEALADAGSTILIREKQARQRPDGSWERAYGFTDGHGEGHVEPDGNFGAWEKSRATVQTAERLSGVVERIETPPKN